MTLGVERLNSELISYQSVDAVDAVVELESDNIGEIGDNDFEENNSEDNESDNIDFLY